jgi:hypothetical protein
MPKGQVVMTAALMLLAATGCGEAEQIHSNTADRQKGAEMTQQTPLVGPLDALEVQRMPAVVPVTGEQTTYVTQLVESVLAVVAGERALDAEERRLLGPGEFFVPKDQRKPLRAQRFYPVENFRVKFVSLSLSRATQDVPWSTATLTVQPKNAPVGAYKLDLPSTLFTNLRLLKSTSEERPANGKAPPQRVQLFEFAHETASSQVRIVFECRQDLCASGAPYPRTFHTLKVTRSL